MERDAYSRQKHDDIYNCSYCSDEEGYLCPFCDTYQMTDSQKIDFVFAVALEAKRLIDEVHPQVVPILASLEKNPMLKMFLKK